jgi:hypothetical protein
MLKASKSFSHQESFSRILPGMTEEADEYKNLEDATIIVTSLTHVVLRLKQMQL